MSAGSGTTPTTTGTCFAVLASDGVFDVMSNEQVHAIVHQVLSKHPGNVAAASRMVAKTAASLNDDDVSCIVVEWGQ
jgi:serine/threonine protein phosphatase PrpC